jgi:hypothetical protein
VDVKDAKNDRNIEKTFLPPVFNIPVFLRVIRVVHFLVFSFPVFFRYGFLSNVMFAAGC